MSVGTWKELSALSNPKLRALVEPNPGIHMPAGGDWTSEGSNTYSHACEEVKVNAATDAGQELVVKANKAEVQATAGTYWFDLADQIVYVRCFDDDDLSSGAVTIVIMVYCWKYWSTDTVEFDGHQYRPIVRQDSLPMLEMSVDDIVEGMYKFNFGSFSVNNDGWFDKAAENYVWTNRRILIKLGGEDLPYANYCVYFVGRISDYHVGDSETIFSVKDIRVGTYAQIPVDHYWRGTDPGQYEKLEEGAEGNGIPLFYGVKKNITPVCIDTGTVDGAFPYPVNSVWKLAGSRKIKEITEIRLNPGGLGELVLTVDTHYTVDLENAEFTLKVAFYEDYYLEVDAKGYVDGGDNLMKKGATIAKDILKTYLDYIDDDLDLDSFTATDTLRTQELAIYADTDESARQVLQTIGRSIVSFFTPTESGKLAFEAYVTVVGPDVLELEDRDFGSDWDVTLDDSFIRNKVKILYDQDPQSQEFLSVERDDPKVIHKYGVRETLDLETYLKVKEDVTNLGDAILGMCSKPMKVVKTSFGVIGFSLFPTRKVKLTRARAVDSSGAWDKKVFRIQKVTKDTTTERTKIIAMDDLQSIGEGLCENCYSCQNCVAAENPCTLCVDCQICVSSEGGCQNCDSCQLCVSDQGGCQVCVTCQLE